MKITAILASHNRRDRTLACLGSYFSQRVAGAQLDAVLVDDGSTDGTADSVEAQFPAAEVVRGDGSLFWAAAMALGERVALEDDPDYLLWLNDDVELDERAVERLVRLSAEAGRGCIVVGAVRDPVTRAITYAGARRLDWHPLRMELVPPAAIPLEVETFHGNVVLVPRSLADAVGPIDGGFAHAAADFDYGLRARRLGIRSVLAPGTAGTCCRDGSVSPWLDHALPFRARLAALIGPKGAPPGSTARYLRRHGGRMWPLFWVATYVKFAAAALAGAVGVRSRGGNRELAKYAAGIACSDDARRNRARDDASCADDRPHTDLRAGEYDDARSHEDVVLDPHPGAFVDSQAGIAARHEVDGVEVGVGHEHVGSEQHPRADLDRARSADRDAAQPTVAADGNSRAFTQRPQDDRMADAEGRVARAGDQRGASSELDGRAAGACDDGAPAHANAGTEVDSQRAQLGQPEQRQRSLHGRGGKATELGHGRSNAERTHGPGRDRPRSLENVVLVGPASPRDLSSLLSGRDRELAETIDGYRGIPVSELAKALVDAGLHVEVATTAPEIDSPLALEGPRLRLHLVPMRPRARDRALSAFSRERAGLCAAIDGADAGVVHAHWTYEFAWAGLDSGRPVVVTAHDAPLTIARHYRDAYRALRTAMAYVVRLRTRRLTAVSPYLADRWRREMRYRRPIAVVPNVAPALPGGLPAGKGQVYIADVADSGRHKNVAGLVRAFRLLRKREHELGLDLVGPGLGAGEALHRALEGEGPCHGIAFHGRLGREQLSSVLSGASVFVHPSYEECCSTAVLEAMQAGVPVVAGRGAGGTPWMLDHGRAGVLVDVGDPGAIADAVAAVLADPELAQTLSERARTRIGEVFSPAAVASAYIDLYEQALTEAV